MTTPMVTPSTATNNGETQDRVYDERAQINRGQHPYWIALVTPGWPLYQRPNGIVTYTHHLKAGLEARGVNVFIIALAGASENQHSPSKNVFYVDGIKLSTGLIGRSLDFIRFRMAHESAVRDYSGARIASIVNELAKLHGYGIIELEESFGIAATLNRSTEVPIVTRMHGPWAAVGINSGARRDRSYHRRVEWEREGLLASDCIIAPNNALQEMLSEELEVRHPNVEVIPNPISIPDDSDRWSAQNADQKHILFVGRLDQCKGIDIMLEAFDLLARQDPELKLTLIGPDSGFRFEDSGNERLADLLNRFVESPEVRNRIDVRGRLDPIDIRSARKRASVCVVPSRFESFGYTVVESMSQGCPTIGASVAGIQDIIDHEKNGLLFHPDDPSHLAETMSRILRNPTEAARLAAAGFTKVLEEYAIDHIADRQLAVYDSLFRKQTRR